MSDNGLEECTMKAYKEMCNVVAEFAKQLSRVPIKTEGLRQRMTDDYVKLCNVLFRQQKILNLNQPEITITEGTLLALSSKQGVLVKACDRCKRAYDECICDK